MASGNAIRGTRVGSSPVRWVDATAERTEAVPRRRVGYWCANGHHTEHAFAADVAVPALWDCPRCGQPAGQDEANPPARPADRAVQDPSRLREGAAQRRRRRGHPRRGDAAPARPPRRSRSRSR